jgi:hypothetical protein
VKKSVRYLSWYEEDVDEVVRRKVGATRWGWLRDLDSIPPKVISMEVEARYCEKYDEKGDCNVVPERLMLTGR